MFAACSKKSDLSVPKTTDPTSQKILNFKAKIETGNKSYETMSVDSAVWYVEAALNYTYDKPYRSEIMKYDSFFVTVPVSADGKISFSDAAEIQFDTELKTILTQNAGAETKLQVADISVKNINGNTANMKLSAIFTQKSAFDKSGSADKAQNFPTTFNNTERMLQPN
jgi:hypothetical protein